MAIYHFSVKTLGKGGGRSAVQFSAYMSGEMDYNERTHETYDHTTKEEVAYKDMYFSSDVPEALRERSKFWNEVEKHEDNINARFSRTWELALDKDASLDQMREQIEAFSKSLIDDGYCAVQVAIHLKEGNPHAHIMAPCRQMHQGEWVQTKEVKGYVCENEEGVRKIFQSVKDIEVGFSRVPILNADGTQKTDSRNRLLWERQTIQSDKLNSVQLLMEQRERWATIMNQHLDIAHQVSHLSYKAQGIAKEPTVHLGYKASQMEREGIRTELGDYNRAVRTDNILKHKNILELQTEIQEKEKFIDKLKQEMEEFLKKISRGVEYASDRLRSIIDRSRTRDTEAFKRESIAQANKYVIRANDSINDRADRENEQLRLRIKAEREAQERSERIKNRSSSRGFDFER